MKNINIIKMMATLKYILCSLLLFTGFSCKKLLEVDTSKSLITNKTVFSSDVTATAAVYGIYVDMLTSGFASGASESVVNLCGLSSDELNYYPLDQSFKAFEENAILPDNENVLALWSSMYSTIYKANSLLEGVQNSTSLSQKVRDQLKGEALFLRAFSHFYLVNLFGKIPWISTTDYKQNATIARISESEVYTHIINDLLVAEEILSDDYVEEKEENKRVRPNKSTVTALLARTYLYTGDWANAEAKATSVIDNPKYSLLPNLDDVFLMNSSEAIWQLKPYDSYHNTNEGSLFILTGVPGVVTNTVALADDLANAFEVNDDLRRMHWIDSIADGGVTYYYPYKYKKSLGPLSGVSLTEYSMVFRLAEQYLIRAEARAQQDNNIAGAQADLNAIRNRAGLANTTASSKAALLMAIEQERKVELFTEWGHRWLDLKRTNRADIVLGDINKFPLKDWQATDVLYPIPQSEININSNLKPQNAGY